MRYSVEHVACRSMSCRGAAHRLPQLPALGLPILLFELCTVTRHCHCAAGKTTLLEVLAGKHMVSRDAVRILGRPAFYDLMLVTSGELGYLGNQWRRNVACAGSDLSLQVPSIFSNSSLHTGGSLGWDVQDNLCDI